jgi:hypothetical protein
MGQEKGFQRGRVFVCLRTSGPKAPGGLGTDIRRRETVETGRERERESGGGAAFGGFVVAMGLDDHSRGRQPPSSSCTQPACHLP